jgi:GntR family transcriptional regulator, carbon starvation induced regulator
MKKSITLSSDISLVRQCYEQLQQEIIQGILKPNEKLTIEPIKQRLGIGQNPIREALCMLVTSGLVEMEENKGFRVVAISETDIRDVYEIFTLIENSALELAIQHGDSDWEANIVAQLYKLSLVEKVTNPESYAIWAKQNHDFHIALIQGCNSPVLLDIRQKLYQKFDRYRYIAYRLRNNQLEINHQEHQALANAVLARDIKKAKNLMSHHINDAIEDVIQELKKYNVI